jgi:hypothetical protein
MTVIGRWRKTIPIKQFLSASDDDENARRVAAKIAAVLKRQSEYVEGRLIPGVSLLLAMVDEADHIETVIAEQAAAYRLTEEKT